jgi:hypothetical protein
MGWSRGFPRWARMAAVALPAVLALAGCSQGGDYSIGDSSPATTSASASPSTSSSLGTLASGPRATTTELTVGTKSPTALEPVTLHVRVKSRGSTTSPTGTVTVFDSGTAVGSASMTTLTGSNVDVTVTLHAGTQLLSARYSGDRLHVASMSATVAAVLKQLPSTVAVNAKRNPKNALEFRFGAGVQTHKAGIIATGDVVFSVAGATYTIALDSQGHAAFHTTFSQNVTYTVTATYLGSADISGSSTSTTFTA